MELARRYSDAVIEFDTSKGKVSGLAVSKHFSGLMAEDVDHPRIKWMRIKSIPDSMQPRFETEFLRVMILSTVGSVTNDEYLLAAIPRCKAIIQGRERAGCVFEGTCRIVDGSIELDFLDHNSIYMMSEDILRARLVELDKEFELMTHEYYMSDHALKSMEIEFKLMVQELKKMDADIERWREGSMQFVNADQLDAAMNKLLENESYRKMTINRQRQYDKLATANFIKDAQKRRVDAMYSEIDRILGMSEKIKAILADQSLIGSKRRMVQDQPMVSRLIEDNPVEEVKEVPLPASIGVAASSAAAVSSSSSSSRPSTMAVAVIEASAPDAVAEEKKELAQRVLYASSSSAVVEESVADAILKHARVEPEVVTREITDKVNAAVAEALQAEELAAAETDEAMEHKEEPTGPSEVVDEFVREFLFVTEPAKIPDLAPVPRDGDGSNKRKIQEMEETAENNDDEQEEVESAEEPVVDEEEKEEEDELPREDDEDSDEYDDRVEAHAYKKFQQEQFNKARESLPKPNPELQKQLKSMSHINPSTGKECLALDHQKCKGEGRICLLSSSSSSAAAPVLDTKKIQPVTMVPAQSVPAQTPMPSQAMVTQESKAISKPIATSAFSTEEEKKKNVKEKENTVLVDVPPPKTAALNLAPGVNLVAVKRRVPLQVTNTTAQPAGKLPSSSSSSSDVVSVEAKTEVINPTQADAKLQQLTTATAAKSGVDLQSAVAPTNKSGGTAGPSITKGGSVSQAVLPVSVSPAEAASATGVKLPTTKMVVALQTSLTEKKQAQVQDHISSAEKAGAKRKADHADYVSNAIAEAELAPKTAVSSSSALKSAADSIGQYVSDLDDGISDPAPPVGTDALVGDVSQLRDQILLGNTIPKEKLTEVIDEAGRLAKGMLSQVTGCAYMFQEEFTPSRQELDRYRVHDAQRRPDKFDENMEIHNTHPPWKDKIMVPFSVVYADEEDPDRALPVIEEIGNADEMRNTRAFNHLTIQNGDSRTPCLVTPDPADPQGFYLVHGDPARGIPEYRIKASFINLWSTCMCRTKDYVFVGLSSISSVAIFKVGEPNHTAKILQVDFFKVKNPQTKTECMLSLDIEDVFACTINAGTDDATVLIFARFKNRVCVNRIQYGDPENQDIAQPQANDWTTVEKGPYPQSNQTFSSPMIILDELVLENAGKKNIKREFVPVFTRVAPKDGNDSKEEARYVVDSVFLSPHYFVGVNPAYPNTFLKRIRMSVMGKPLPYQYYYHLDQLRNRAGSKLKWEHMDFGNNVARIHKHEQEFVEYWILAAMVRGALGQAYLSVTESKMTPTSIPRAITKVVVPYFTEKYGWPINKAKEEAAVVEQLATISTKERAFPPFGPELITCSEINSLVIPYDGFTVSRDGKTVVAYDEDTVMVFRVAVHETNKENQPSDVSNARYQLVPIGLSTCYLVNTPKQFELVKAKDKVTKEMSQKAMNSKELQDLLSERDFLLEPLITEIEESVPMFPNSMIDEKEKTEIVKRFNQEKKTKIAELEDKYNQPIMDFCLKVADEIYAAKDELARAFAEKEERITGSHISFCYLRGKHVLAARGTCLYVLEIQDSPLRAVQTEKKSLTTIGELMHVDASTAAETAAASDKKTETKHLVQILLRELATDEMKVKAGRAKTDVIQKVMAAEQDRLTREYKKKNKTKDDSPQDVKDDIYKKAHITAAAESDRAYEDALDRMIEKNGLVPTAEMKEKGREMAEKKVQDLKMKVYKETMTRLESKLTRYADKEVQDTPPILRVMSNWMEMPKYEMEYAMYESLRMIKVMDFNREVIGIDDRLYPEITVLFELGVGKVPPIQSESRRAEWPAERDRRYTYGDTFQFDELVRSDRLKPATGVSAAEVYSFSRLPDVPSETPDCRLYSDDVADELNDVKLQSKGFTDRNKEMLILRYLAVERLSLFQQFKTEEPQSPYYGGYKTEPPARLLRYLSKFNYSAISDEVVQRFMQIVDSSDNKSSIGSSHNGKPIVQDRVADALKKIVLRNEIERAKFTPLCASFALLKNTDFKSNLAYGTNLAFWWYETKINSFSPEDDDVNDALQDLGAVPANDRTLQRMKRQTATALLYEITGKGKFDEETEAILEEEGNGDDDSEAEMLDTAMDDEVVPAKNSVQQRRVGDVEDTAMEEVKRPKKTPAKQEDLHIEEDIVDDIVGVPVSDSASPAKGASKPKKKKKGKDDIDTKTQGRGKRAKPKLDYAKLNAEMFGDAPDSDDDGEYMDEPDIEEEGGDRDDDIED